MSPPRDPASRSHAPGGICRRRLPREGTERLRRQADFSQVMRKGRRARHPLLHLVALHTEAAATRIGFSVGKQVGGAVVRNRVKRRLRAIVRELDWQPGYDVVIVARPGSDSAKYEELRSAVCENARKNRLLNGPRGQSGDVNP